MRSRERGSELVMFPLLALTPRLFVAASGGIATLDVGTDLRVRLLSRPGWIRPEAQLLYFARTREWYAGLQS